MPERDEVLTLDRLASGDRPSVFIAGMALGQALQKTKVAVFAINALGHVVLMPPGSIKVLSKPKVKDEELHSLSEDDALQVMLKEERSEAEIIEYLKKREALTP
jgi:hypothetical protein